MVFKEFRISIIVSSVLAVVNGVRIYIMYQHKCDYPFMLALTIALSIIATVILSKVIGSMLPMLAKKCRLDPAIMATPLITTIVDCCSLFLYFNIATIVFSHIEFCNYKECLCTLYLIEKSRRKNYVGTQSRNKKILRK